ncbi:MAG: indole-3-glycerol phosphate synthase TrpC [Alphaproteobacteria bacterium]|nr:indole-3-glycerol phosphate synthase TrpC [Alphaproteobacteria bacterium]
MTILDDIIAYKRVEVAQAKAAAPFAAIDALARDAAPPRGFRQALERAAETRPALIAEIKKASPSKGLIRADFDPPRHARDYEAGGAACLSVLTDSPSFQGSPDFLKSAREAVTLPILRKDFMVDPYQVAEARAWGADAILIIMACTDDELAGELMAAAARYEMDALVETHDATEMARAGRLGATLIGVNNRDLRTFATDLSTTARLSTLAPPSALLVAESGIASRADIDVLAANGAKAFLVGETLMRADDVAAATRALIEPVEPRLA